MRFTKMQALGNDYVCLDLTLEQPGEELSRLARALTNRHFGVGGDGLLCVLPGSDGRLRMALYNADGSRAAMCGNGIRCLAAYAWSHGLAEEGRPLTVETDAGLRTLTAAADGIRVEMGRPVLGESLVLEAGGRPWRVRPVSMGNPHAVIFVPRLDRAPLEQVGPELEHHRAFLWRDSGLRYRRLRRLRRGGGLRTDGTAGEGGAVRRRPLPGLAGPGGTHFSGRPRVHRV